MPTYMCGVYVRRCLAKDSDIGDSPLHGDGNAKAESTTSFTIMLPSLVCSIHKA